jgi:hypothetical protein
LAYGSKCGQTAIINKMFLGIRILRIARIFFKRFDFYKDQKIRWSPAAVGFLSVREYYQRLSTMPVRVMTNVTAWCNSPSGPKFFPFRYSSV